MKRLNKNTAILALITALTTAATGCTTANSLLALDSNSNDTRPINNPFGTFYSNSQAEPASPIILRTKKGDRSVEVELPRQEQAMTDFVIPISPAFKDSFSGRSPASLDRSSGTIDQSYSDRAPTASDREIIAAMPQGATEDASARQEIETGLGLTPNEDSAPQHDKSYLASIDQIKQLYRMGRFEAALIDVDSVLRLYQTDGKLYEMRGTLLERLGKRDLAIKAWNQALRFDPNNVALRRLVERRQQTRGLASP